MLLAMAMAMWSSAAFGQSTQTGVFSHSAGITPTDITLVGSKMDIAFPSYNTVYRFDLLGNQIGQVYSGSVSSITTNLSGQLYVDQTNEGVVFAPSGWRYEALGVACHAFDATGGQPASYTGLSSAAKVAYDAVNNCVAVADAAAGTVVVLNPTTMVMITIETVAGANGVVFDNQGNLLVSGSDAVYQFSPVIGGNGFVQDYAPNGSFDLAGSPSGPLNGPTAMRFGANGRLFIVEPPENQIRIVFYVPPAPLPIELISFGIERDVLHWETATEVNFSGFEVQHSLDGATFKEVGFVPGAGDGYGATYTMEVTLEEGVNYFRLKQIDLDGTYEYSPMVSAEGDKAEEGEVYPNPSDGIVNISKPAMVFDRYGRLVETTTPEILQTHLPSGVYFVRFLDDHNGRLTPVGEARKLIVQ